MRAELDLVFAYLAALGRSLFAPHDLFRSDRWGAVRVHLLHWKVGVAGDVKEHEGARFTFVNVALGPVMYSNFWWGSN